MCTDFTIETTGSQTVNGRSLEFGLELNSKLFFRKAGYKYVQEKTAPKFDHTWTGKYAFVGMNGLGLDIVIDGINTEGLSVSALWLPGTVYQTITDPKKGIAADYFCNWILSACATSNDVSTALNNGDIQVGEIALMQEILPIHYAVHDKNGNSIVIEFLEGEPVIYDNLPGVCTNDPHFSWHLENLRNYVSLTPNDVAQAPDTVSFGNLSVSATGHGTGLMPIPGNSTPPARFVRAAAMKTFALQPDSLDAATNLAFHVLNTVDIPEGTSASTEEKLGKTVTQYDYTQWTTVKDLSRQIYTIRMYGTPLTYSIDLNDVKFEEMDGQQIEVPATALSIPLNESITVN